MNILLKFGCIMLISLLTGALGNIPNVQIEFWGSGPEGPDDTVIKPFKINISDEDLNYFKEKLESTREFKKPLKGIAFEYGINTDYLKEMMDYWKTKYDWREREKYLNSLPQYVTQIGGLEIHFIHAKPDPVKAKGKKILPLLMMHGWPSSPREFYDVIPLLTEVRAEHEFVFEVIAPSLPGFGFSEGASRPGLGAAQVGAIMNELMARLGHSQYYIQGTDFGSAVGYTMSVLFPNRVVGYHTNYCLTTTTSAQIRILAAYMFPSLFVDRDKREKYVNQFADTFLLEFGFFHIQATKPDTIGVSLTDSPAGLAAYFLEKFSTWTNKSFRSLHNGGLDTYKKDDLLDHIMIYWFTESITTSMRIYSETFNKKYLGLGVEKQTVTVPTGCARFPNDLLYFPNTVLKAQFPNVVISDFAEGGHFPAMEQPQLLSQDVWSFVSKIKAK